METSNLLNEKVAVILRYFLEDTTAEGYINSYLMGIYELDYFLDMLERGQHINRFERIELEDLLTDDDVYPSELADVLKNGY